MKKFLGSAVVAALLVMVPAQFASAGYVTEQGYGVVKQTVEQERAGAKAFLNSLKGKTFWIVPNAKATQRISFFDTLDDIEETSGPYDTVGSFRPDSTTSFVVDKIHTSIYEKNSAANDRYFAKVTFADGRVGYVDAREVLGYQESSQYLDPKSKNDATEYLFSIKPAPPVPPKKLVKAAGPKKGGVMVGMSKEQALASSWGRPESVNKTTTAYGTSEQWVYGGSNYLYFENGVLTAIQH